MGSEREKHAGFYIFPDTWLGSEVQKCSLQAKGLWMDMLMQMWGREPRGVLPGDGRAFAAAMGRTLPGEDAGYFKAIRLCLDELEAHNVFSRGAEIDHGLPEDAIVNRRMYREWCKEKGRVARAKKAARARWGAETQRDAQHRGKSANAKACLGDATGIGKSDAKGMLADGGDPSASQGVTKISECLGDACEMPEAMLGECHSLPSPPLPEPDPPEPNERSRTPGKRDGPGGRLFQRVLLLTGDAASWRKWWIAAIKAFEADGQLHEVTESVQYVEDCRAGRVRKEIKAPGPFLVSAVLRKARVLGIAVPATPKRGAP